MSGNPEAISTLPRCPVCGRAAELSDVSRYPFACRRCVCKHFDELLRAQEAAIEFWKSTTVHRRGWGKAIEDGLRRLGL